MELTTKLRYLFSFGSIVQNGKFSAGAALLVKTLKKVDFPTFGTPESRNEQTSELSKRKQQKQQQ